LADTCRRYNPNPPTNTGGFFVENGVEFAELLNFPQ